MSMSPGTASVTSTLGTVSDPLVTVDLDDCSLFWFRHSSSATDPLVFQYQTRNTKNLPLGSGMTDLDVLQGS